MSLRNWLAEQLWTANGKEISRLREKREKIIRKYHGDNRVNNVNIIDMVVETGMKEAKLRGMEPDLLLVHPEQKKVLDTTLSSTFDELTIVSYDWINSMCLVDSKAL